MAAPPPKHWKPPTTWQFASPAPRHFVQATACGKARRSHPVTTDWDEVNCPECLQRAPYRREKRR